MSLLATPPAAAPPETATGVEAPASHPSVPPVDAPARRGRPGTIVGGLILVALGLVFLAGNLVPTPGAVLFLGLGGAFLLARVATGVYGFAVPAGVLLGFGTFVGLTESRLLFGPVAGGAFF